MGAIKPRSTVVCSENWAAVQIKNPNCKLYNCSDPYMSMIAIYEDCFVGLSAVLFKTQLGLEIYFHFIYKDKHYH